MEFSLVHLTLHMQAEDIEGVELCGTLKNIVAIAAGSIWLRILFGYIHWFKHFNGLCSGIILQALLMAWIWETIQKLRHYYLIHFK